MGNYIDNQLISVLQDDEKMERFFEDFNEEKLKNFLIYIHSRVFKIDFEKDEFAGVRMICGKGSNTPALVSPSKEIQEKALENIAKSLKNISGRRNKAILLHYLENQLHLFSDGNGRTGRAIVELFFNKNFDFDTSEVTMHEDSKETDSGTAKISTRQLEEKYDIMYICDAMGYASYMVYLSLLQNALLPSNLDNICTIQANVFYDQGDIPNGLNSKVMSQLTAEQAVKVVEALSDNSAEHTSSALAMLVMKNRLSQNVNFEQDDVSEIGIDGLQGFNVAGNLGFDLDIKETFENWGKEDFLLLREVYERIKEMQVDIMLDIFETPNNFKLNKDTTILDVFNQNLGRMGEEVPEVIVRSWKTTEINLEGTRMQEHLNSLAELLRRERPLENVEEPISVHELGELTLEQQKDFKGKDELKQLESRLSRLEADLNKAEEKSL